MHVSTKTGRHTQWRPLPLSHITVTGGFWGHKQTINRQISLRHGYQQLERSGNLNNLRLVIGTGEGEFRGPVFMDSDIYKWLEATAYDLANVPTDEIAEMVDEVIEMVVAAQAEDGYLNSHYQIAELDERWTDIDHGHELYCAGHLFEAAVAMHRATGDARLLNVARRFADHINDVFGHDEREGAPGHPEIELALVELYRETDEERYLELAEFFINQRGSGQMRGYRYYGPEYHQDHVPVREADAVAGHAVRQLYLTAGATDLYLETGEDALMEAMERLWHDMTTRKMHITAGLGARFTGESFGDPYELPSDRCYCETCAAIANIMWNWRMLLAKGEGRFADLLERSLYNGFLSGISLDGRRYFYVNPLQSRGGIERPEWYGCACCPPNIMRTIAVVGHYAATVADDGIQLHQYLSSVIRTTGVEGPDVVLKVETGYPWEGDVHITVEETPEAAWMLSLRIPEWSSQVMVQINGSPIKGPGTGEGYLTVSRTWQPGDGLVLSLSLAPRLTAPNPRVDAIRGSVCVERGPLVYCLEAADQEADLSLLDVRLDPAAAMTSTRRTSLLDGVTTVEMTGQVVDQGPWEDELYLPVAEDRTLPSRGIQLTAVPYYAWANRGPGAMRVWIPKTK